MNYKRLIISIVIPQAIGLLGSFFTRPAISTWYAGLEKPFFNPPSWIFGPVWVFLYFIIGISIYLIWQKIEENERAPGVMRLFGVHLIFNAIWSIIFFGLKSPGLALIDITILWLLIIILMIKFWKINKLATYLFTPYLIWVSFAATLNYFIWHLN